MTYKDNTQVHLKTVSVLVHSKAGLLYWNKKLENKIKTW